MRLKLISCNVFMREACQCIARTPHVIDVEFTELGEHIHSETLRATIQGRIDAAEASNKGYDAILLLFGLCGNAGVDLHARNTPLVIPRAHDCCTILLGSRETFAEHFADNPSTPFSSAGYMERGDYFLRVEEGQATMHFGDAYAALVEQYGEEDARYIWEAMHPAQPGRDRAVFIDLPETAHLGYREQFTERVTAEGKTPVYLDGSLSLIARLIDGQWDAADFVIVPPGRHTVGVYDWTEIMRAE